MDPAKASFLFGTWYHGSRWEPDPEEDLSFASGTSFDPPWLNALLAFHRRGGPQPDDEPELPAEQLDGENLAEEDGDDPERVRSMFLAVLALQVASEEPPEVWATAKRLLASGLSPQRAMDQILMAFAGAVASVPDGPGRRASSEVHPDRLSGFVATLSRLPLPEGPVVRDSLVAVVRERPGLSRDEAVRLACEAMGRGGDELTARLVEQVAEAWIVDGTQLALVGDELYHVGDLTKTAVLTHVLSDAEVRTGQLDAGFDLGPFARVERPCLGDEVLGIESNEEGHVAWIGPEGWLERYGPGALLAVRSDEEGRLTFEQVGRDSLPGGGEEVGEILREAHDEYAERARLPMDGNKLVLSMLVRDRSVFSAPGPPLRELATSAGLEVRRSLVAGERSQWVHADRVERMFRLEDEFDNDEMRALQRLVEAMEDPGADEADLRRALRDVRDADLLSAVTDELVGDHEGPNWVLQADAMGEALAATQRAVAVARRSDEIVVARWLAASVCERGRDPVTAATHVEECLAAGDGWDMVLDRAAGYASDRGDAARAFALWSKAGKRGRRKAEVVAHFARASHPDLGRNETCWCGSGRKYKFCHLGQVRELSLAERSSWLWQKAVWHLQRDRDRSGSEMFDTSISLLAEDHTAFDVLSVMSSPLVADIVLVERGWWDRFVEDRGPLLPPDELAAASGWSRVRRRLWEVVEPGGADGRGPVVLRDADGADRTLTVRGWPGGVDPTEVNLGRIGLGGPHPPGSVVCGRVVPAGDDGLVMVGTTWAVPAGAEADMDAVLAAGDAAGLCAWLAAAAREPDLVEIA